MSILRLYQVTLQSVYEANDSLNAIVIPKAALGEWGSSEDSLREKARNFSEVVLDAKVVRYDLVASEIPLVLVCIMQAAKSDDDAIEILERLLPNPSAENVKKFIPEATWLFAQEASYGRYIPFEQSDPVFEAMGTLASKAGPLGVGAGAAVLIATGAATPVLLIWLVTGIVVVYAAQGIGERVRAWFRKSR
jgi:hypothetical protein